MSLFYETCARLFLAEPFQVVSTIAKEDANHIDTQSEGWRCKTWQKAIDGSTSQSWASRHLSIHERTGPQEGSQETDRPHACRRRRRDYCKGRVPARRQRHSLKRAAARHGEYSRSCAWLRRFSRGNYYEARRRKTAGI